MASLTSLKSLVTLNDGVQIPVVGYGTYLDSAATTDCLDDVTEADYLAMKSFLKDTVVDNGYIHLDTAEMYHTERLIGRALKELNVDRSKLFIASKIMPKDDIRRHLPIRRLDRAKTIETVHRSLQYLQTEYIDLYLVHSPHSLTGDGRDVMEVYETLLELQKEGKIRSVGVSNFGVDHLRTLIEARRLQIPSVNQIEANPFVQDPALLAFCKRYDIKIEAYGPVYQGDSYRFKGVGQEISCLEHPLLRYIGKRHGKNAAQVMLRWSVQSGFIPITKSTKPRRNRENVQIFDFELSADEMQLIGMLREDDAARHNWNPMKKVKWDYTITAKL